MAKTTITDADWGWLAGLIDGDGCISIQRLRGRYYSASIIVVNKKPENVLKLMRLFGGSLGRTARQSAASYVNGVYYRWTMKASADVLRCMTHALPHFAEKRARALLAIELCEVQAHYRALRTYKNREGARAKMDLIYRAALSGPDGRNERPARELVGQATAKE